MLLNVVGKKRKIYSFENGKSFPGTFLYYSLPAEGVDGEMVEHVWISEKKFPYEEISIGGKYFLEFNRQGKVALFAPAESNGGAR